jgi:hypothetical protein
MRDPSRERTADERTVSRSEVPVEAPRPVRDTGPATPDDRSVMELIRSLADDSRTLFRQEVTLAKAEMREKLQVYEQNLVKIIVGATFLMAAVLLVLWAANMGVTALLSQFVDPAIAVWLAPLLLGATLALIGYAMVKGSARRMREEGVVPEQTMQSLRDDTNWAKEQVRHG